MVLNKFDHLLYFVDFKSNSITATTQTPGKKKISYKE